VIALAEYHEADAFGFDRRAGAKDLARHLARNTWHDTWLDDARDDGRARIRASVSDATSILSHLEGVPLPPNAICTLY